MLGTPAAPNSDVVNITVTLNGSGPASTSFPKVKYNKAKAIIMDFDDNDISINTAYEKLSNTFYTDGCGNNKNFNVGMAVNAKNNFNNAEWADNYPGKTTYAQRAALIPLGLDIMNHSYYHEPDGNFSNGANVLKNFLDMDAFILEKQSYKMNAMVVPTNYSGYHIAARDNGYLVGSSEGTFDGLTPYPGEFNPFGLVNNIPQENYNVIKRTFTDNWTNSGVQWSAIEELFTGSAEFFEIGTHGIGQGVGNFNAWIDSIVQRSNDTTLFQSLREFMEYKHMKDNVVKNEQMNGGTLKVTLDYSAIPNQNISWFDLSLLVQSGQSITSVVMDNSDFELSYNISTKLINVTKRKITW